MTEARHRCGFAAIVGRPNVGKSTLLNALLRTKVSIVTPKPQTTRHRILGISTTPDDQVIFVDTPGLHQKAPRAINRSMNRTALQTLFDADVVLFVTEALSWTDDDRQILARLSESENPVILVVNKSDCVKPKDRLLPFIDRIAGEGEFEEVVPVSALKRTNVERLRPLVLQFLPLSEPLYSDDQISDRDDAFRAAEIIREKLTLHLHQELPYGLAVSIEKFESSGKGLTISAVVLVERPGQKGIVIGKDGEQLKRAGRAARLELKAAHGCPVHLEIWVKVQKNWSDSDRALRQLGYGMQ